MEFRIADTSPDSLARLTAHEPTAVILDSAISCIGASQIAWSGTAWMVL
jgi:hypothetical protein